MLSSFYEMKFWSTKLTQLNSTKAVFVHYLPETLAKGAQSQVFDSLILAVVLSVVDLQKLVF